MAETTRKHTRIATRRSVLLEVRRSNAGSIAITRTTETKETFAVETINVSAEGIGLDLSPIDELGSGTSVRVLLKIGARTLALPAQVAWARISATGSQGGLKLHTQVLDTATRRAFETFLRDVGKSTAA